MLAYVFAVAVLNVVVGFALAAYLGRRYHALIAAETALAHGGRAPTVAVGASRNVAGPESAIPPAPATPPRPAEDMAAGDDLPGASGSASAGFQVILPDDVPAPRGTMGRSLDDLRAELENFDSALCSVDERLRVGAETETDAAGELGSCAAAVTAASDEYLERRRSVCADFEAATVEDRVVRDLQRRLREAFEQQNEQIDAARDAMAQYDPDGDAQKERRRLITETSRLIDGNYRVREVIEDAASRADQIEGRRESSRTPDADPLVGRFDRDELEDRMAQWWQHDPRHVRRLAAALIDVDQFSQVNARYGHKLGNKLLRQLEHYLDAERRAEKLGARFSGQRFLLLFPDGDSRTTTQFAERIRQTIELSCFRHQRDEIRVTVSCAVAEVGPGDTTEAILQRLETTLHEAKRYGRNRTFLHDGTYPTPVVPPNLPLEERHVEI